MKVVRTGYRLRSWSVLLAALSISFVLVAPSLSSGSTVASARGGTLTVVYVGSNISGMDPGGPTTTAGSPEMSVVFDPLFNPTSNGSVSPSLATSYKTSNAGKTITLFLQKGVKFQDGTSFNAAAVVYNIKRDASPVQDSECVTYYQTLQSVKAIGQYEVTVTFTRPDPGYISLISTQQCGLMASPSAIQSEGANFGLHPVGTGPYVIDSYQLTSGTFSRWSGYWRKGDPKFNNLDVILVGSDTAAFAALQSGQAQIYITATPQTVVQAKSTSGLRAIKETAVAADAVTFNFEKPPFNSLTAREAVAYAINPQPIIAAVGHGIYKPYEGLIAKGSWAYSPLPSNLQKYNPTKAASLVKSLGGLSFSLLSYNDPTNEQVATLLQSQFQAVGMQVTIDALPQTNAISDLHSHDYQAANIGPAGGGPVPPDDPDLQFHRWFYSTSPLNQIGIDDPTLDNDLNKATSVFNQSVRKAWYQKAEQELVKELPFTAFMSEPYYSIESDNVRGFIPTSAVQNFYNVSLG